MRPHPTRNDRREFIMARPRKDPNLAKRWPIGCRTTAALAQSLAQAAHVSGRSLAQEIEYRLQASFDIPSVVSTVVDRILSLPRAAAEAVDNRKRHECAHCGSSWISGAGMGRAAHGKYCSAACRVAAGRERRRRANIECMVAEAQRLDLP